MSRSGSAELIAAALDAILSDSLTREQMARNSYRLAVERFSWERVGRLTAELCAQVAGL